MSCCERKDERGIEIEIEPAQKKEGLECSAKQKREATGASGSVMVVGGGIGGMQSALDLAETGFKVYLVEKQPAIGGMMARLDKTFPTNDCAMCTMSPKLVDTGRHLNIEIITGAEIKQVDGSPGNFRVRLKKKARYVDVDKCTGCGDCARTCPVEVTNSFDEGLGGRKAVYKLYPQATPGAFAIEKKGTPPCRAACPAGVNAQGYVQLIKTGRVLEAWELIYRDNPFPAVCGRICNHPCQSRCHRGEVDAPVQIRNLKRVAADFAYHDPAGLPLAAPAGAGDDRVAIVGAGPGGLAAARDLALRGYKVTVFEALPVAGGMMRVGIPEYRLPKQWVDLEVDLIKKLGVEIKTNTPIGGKDLTIKDLLTGGYRAVLLATGAHKGMLPPIPGVNVPGVEHAVPFLRRVNLGEKVDLKGRVVVVGGGNVAMDAARVARRLGAAPVRVVSLEPADQMPAAGEEVQGAKEEGVLFTHSRGIKSVIERDGKVAGLETWACSSVFDNEGRFNPTYVEGSEEVMEADYVIMAVGQAPDLSLAEGLEGLTDGRRLAADPRTKATPVPGVFACGDAVTGPRFVIDAIAGGRAAAESIHGYIQGVDLTADRQFGVPDEKIAPMRFKVEEVPRVEPICPAVADATGRATDFREEILAYTMEEAQKEAERCLNCGVCSECLQCEKACLAGALNHNMQDEEIELAVGAVVLNPGFSPFDAHKLDYYGFGRFPNVVTSIQFERILSASGPYQGHLIRPVDGKEPKRIAWIQCAGSRNEKLERGYCSGVCCMYAIKQSIIANEHSHDPLETTIFYMDMRTHGKDFEKYYNRARDEYGVRFVRSRIYEVEETEDGTGNLRIRYAGPDGAIHHEEFDLVVLSVGLEPAEGSAELAAAAGISLNEYGFCLEDAFNPGVTSRPGIFAGGAFCEPKDIPETVAAAGTAAAHCSRLLSDARWTETRVKEYPPERDVTEEDPRVGVFVCNCGINIGGVIRVPEVVEFAKTLDGVVHAEEFLFTCSQDSIAKIKERINEHHLNRVVVASCTPRTHAPLFQSSLREAGLNPYLYEQVNIREHCSWVHRDTPPAATDKAKHLVEMGVSKARLLQPTTTSFIDIDHRALVVGGGAAGMTAALSLGEQGFEVYLVEKESELGGNLRHIRYTLEGPDPAQLLSELKDRVRNHPKVNIFTEAELVDATGYTGNFTTTVRVNGRNEELKHGAVVIAAGAVEVKPVEYLYGSHRAVLTQTELEERLAAGATGGAKNVVMIQCVGSREENRPYCSRVCCSHAIKNALKIKELDPEANVYVLYRDIRTYGFKEKYYTEARRKGVIFIRYEVENKPGVKEAGDGVEVTVYDPILGRDIVIEADILALSAGMAPGAGNDRLSQLYKVPLNADGFFNEAHMKLRPVDFAADGLYLCGLAHSPKTVGESIAQANAAAVRAVTLLAKDRLQGEAIVATVNEKRCRGCELCVKVCNYGARVYDPERHIVTVNEVLCQGCGACAAACPSGATQQKGFEKTQIMSMLEAALA